MKFLFRYSRRFLSDAGKLFTEEELQALGIALLRNPTIGDVIPGGSGLRKMRFAAKGMGKRGGSRVIYLLKISDDQIILLAAYGKNYKSDLSKDEIKNLIEESKKS
ncbi:MAG: type II toxin-antitoxin system RelE/ParE family toxin [Verrucomicrobiales bacterium]|nr:type II toxin-antitoxin system RelE/ParE family toxin [Verrucomicrobiales bacterium]